MPKAAPPKTGGVRRAPKRRRAPWPWRAILGTLLAGNVAAGLLLSPALSVRKVVVEGAEEGEAPGLEAAIAGLRGRPLARVDGTGIEGAALADGRFAGAEFRRSPSGSARLRLARRRAVAVLVGKPPLMVDAEGTVYDAPGEGYEGLPRLLLPRSLRVTAATLGAPVDVRRLAGLAAMIGDLSASEARAGRKIGIEVRERGVICLNLMSSRVVLGTGDQLEAKLSALRRILAQKPGLLTEVKELNLMAPERPKVVPRPAPTSTSVSPSPDPAPPAFAAPVPGSSGQTPREGIPGEGGR